MQMAVHATEGHTPLSHRRCSPRPPSRCRRLRRRTRRATPRRSNARGSRRSSSSATTACRPPQRSDVRRDADGRLVSITRLPHTEVLRVPNGQLVEALHELNADPRVAYAEPNAPVHALTQRHDWWDQWSLLAAVATRRRDRRRGRMGSEHGRGGDRGGDRHRRRPDLASAARCERAAQLTPTTWPRLRRAATRSPDDQNGHGSHVSGIIAAVKDNVYGIAGIAPNAKLLEVRVLDAGRQRLPTRPSRTASTTPATMGARIVNASLGGPGISADDQQRRSPRTRTRSTWSRRATTARTTTSTPDTPAPCRPTTCSASAPATSIDQPRVLLELRRAVRGRLRSRGRHRVRWLNNGSFAEEDGTSMASPRLPPPRRWCSAAQPQPHRDRAQTGRDGLGGSSALAERVRRERRAHQRDGGGCRRGPERRSRRRRCGQRGSDNCLRTAERLAVGRGPRRHRRRLRPGSARRRPRRSGRTRTTTAARRPTRPRRTATTTASATPATRDKDNDGIPDLYDNCPSVRNTIRRTRTGTGSGTPASSRRAPRPRCKLTGLKLWSRSPKACSRKCTPLKVGLSANRAVHVRFVLASGRCKGSRCKWTTLGSFSVSAGAGSNTFMLKVAKLVRGQARITATAERGGDPSLVPRALSATSGRSPRRGSHRAAG